MRPFSGAIVTQDSFENNAVLSGWKKVFKPWWTLSLLPVDHQASEDWLTSGGAIDVPRKTDPGVVKRLRCWFCICMYRVADLWRDFPGLDSAKRNRIMKTNNSFFFSLLLIDFAKVCMWDCGFISSLHFWKLILKKWLRLFMSSLKHTQNHKKFSLGFYLDL